MLLLVFIVPNIIYAQIEQDINVLLVKSNFIENYLFIELLIQNRSSETIYVLKDYYIDEIIEIDDFLKLEIKSNRLNGLVGYNDAGEMEWISLAMWHEPSIIEVRNNQISFLTLLLDIPDQFVRINKNSEINEIIGIKYSIMEYKFITRRDLWEEDVLLFIENIRKNFYDLEYRRIIPSLIW